MNIKKTPSNSWDLHIREKYPNLFKDVDYGGSYKKLVRAMCLSCEESKSGIRDCEVYTCPLWRARLGTGFVDAKVGEVPTKEDYERWNKKV